MIGSHFHLSKPFRSYLAVLNFHTSWLSREIVFTVLFFLTTGSLLLLHWLGDGRTKLKTVLGCLAILFGFALIFCMSQIYLLPTQSAWNSPFTILSFYLTMLFLGCMALPAILLIDFSFSNMLALGQVDEHFLLIRRVLIWSTSAAILAWAMIVALNAYQILMLRTGDQWAQTSFTLLTNLYFPLLVMRLTLPLLGIVWLAASVARAVRQTKTIKELMIPVYSSCICVLVGEILGRFLFYAMHIRIGV
jgi:anaerobic dimethyl sulfoxide reductase subunit C (anchor subunit)